MIRRAWQDGGEAMAAEVAARRGVHVIDGTPGDDRLTGTASADRFNLTDGGADFAKGFAGDDVLVFGDTFTAADQVNGGEGLDKILLNGDYSDGLVLDPEQLKSIEKVVLAGSSPYNLAITDGFEEIAIAGSYRSRLFEVNVDASALTTGSLVIRGGFLAETIIGGERKDMIAGGGGGDSLTGGEGKDRFIYTFPSDSPSNPAADSVDTILDFEEGDRIVLPVQEGLSYHLGETENHRGDILIEVDESSNVTHLTIFTSSDDVSDMQIDLNGTFDLFTIRNEHQLILG